MRPRQKRNEQPERHASSSGPAASHVKRDAGHEHRQFDDERRRNRIPETQAEIRSVREHGHVRAVRDHIEHPVAQDACGEEQRDATRLRANHQPPANSAAQPADPTRLCVMG